MKKLITVLSVILLLGFISTVFNLPEAYSQGQNDSKSNIAQHIKTENADKTAAGHGIAKFFSYTGFSNATTGHLIMLVVGLFFIFLAIKYDYEPLLLIPIGVGILIGNIPFMEGF